MQPVIAVFLLLLPAALALPSVQGATAVLPNACTRACADKYACNMLIPYDCICRNNVYASCATKCCQSPPPTNRSCTVTGDYGADCAAACQANHPCPQKWPQSCYCANAVALQCAEQCGAEATAEISCPSQPVKL